MCGAQRARGHERDLRTERAVVMAMAVAVAAKSEKLVRDASGRRIQRWGGPEVPLLREVERRKRPP
jgi:hypothetical protein